MPHWVDDLVGGNGDEFVGRSGVHYSFTRTAIMHSAILVNLCRWENSVVGSS
jgi:hypothetical protein